MRNLLIWSVLYYLRFWARCALFLSKAYVIGVAGSVGKSSTRNMLYAALKDSFSVKMVGGNSETGVPLGILGIKIGGYTKKEWLKMLLKAPLGILNLRHTQYLIVEMGVDDPFPPKNMEYLLTIVKPDMSIDLNATATHTQQFEKILPKSIRESNSYLIKKIAEEDSKIITNGYTKVGIYNGEDKNLDSIIQKNSPKESVSLLTFGIAQNNTLFLDSYDISTKRTKFVYRVPSERGSRLLEVTLQGILLPKTSYESFAAVLLVAYALKLEYEVIVSSIEKNFKVPKGRSTLLPGVKNSIIIDSSYNSSKSTVIAFLDMVKILKQQSNRPAVFLMGDMRELGEESLKEHEEVAEKLISIVDEVHCVGEQTLQYVVPFVKNAPVRRRPKKVEWYKNAIQAGLHLKEELPQNAIVLVKGSQNTIFLEEAIKFLLSNPADVKKLTRQEDYWMMTKQNFFNI